MVLCNEKHLRQLCKYLGAEVQSMKSDDLGSVVICASDLNGINQQKDLVSGFGTIALALSKKINKSLLGSTDEEEACVRQWVEYAICYINLMDCSTVYHQVLKELNSVLADKTFFVSNQQSLVDKMYYYLLYDIMSKLSFQEKEQYVHLSRWFNYLQQDKSLRQDNKLVIFSRKQLYV